jgi:hypothetical protein
MAERGEIEPFHCAIFADTGWESSGTYVHLEWLKQIGKCPIIVVKSEMGSIYDWSLECRVRYTKKFSVMPFFTAENGKKGILRRQCTDHFKITPIRKKTRELLGLKARQHAPQGAVEQCVGISLDEARRMKVSRERMTTLSYPLVDMRISRHDCERWLATNYAGLVVPKSACVGCPFHRDHEWRNVKSNPLEWEQAVNLDNAIRTAGLNTGRTAGLLYLHSSCKPLEEVDLRTHEEKSGQLNLFDWAKDEKLGLFVRGLEL